MAHEHNCSCGHDHDHEHHHDHEHEHMDKYHEAFAKFDPAGTEEIVGKHVASILEKHEKENFTPEVLKQIHGCIDLTSLTSIDTKESIWKLVDRRYPPRRSECRCHLHLSPIRGNSQAGIDGTGSKDRLGSCRVPLLTDIHRSEDCRNSHGSHDGSRRDRRSDEPRLFHGR